MKLFTLIAILALSALAQTDRARTFSSPEEARDALLQTLETEGASLESIFGPGSKSLLTTGDKDLDAKRRVGFVQAMKSNNTLVPYGLTSDYLVLEVGEDAWPFPIPIVRSGGKWAFDIEDGKDELRRRIIGGNELDVIALCEIYVAAQLQYAEADRNGNGLLQYAQLFRSTPGKKDGLYWDGDDSPVAREFADAVMPEESRPAKGSPVPYHGYNFKLLKSQGPAAPGGARSYVVQGQMIGGFALLAWPAKYGVSGVKTFKVSHDGIVYDKDLGTQTAILAPAITKFNPDSTWTPID